MNGLGLGNDGPHLRTKMTPWLPPEVTSDALSHFDAILYSKNGNPSRKGGKTIDLYYYINVLKVKPVYQQMTLSPKLGVVEISTLWHFRFPLPIQMFIKAVSSPRLSGIGMPSPIL